MIGLLFRPIREWEVLKGGGEEGIGRQAEIFVLIFMTVKYVKENNQNTHR